MRRILLALMLCSAPLTAFEGFYVGGGLGGHLTEAGQDSQVLGTLESLTYFPSIQKELFDRGATGMLYAGYGLKWCSLYLAAEGFVQFGAAHLHDRDSNIIFKDNSQLYQVPSETKGHITCCQGGIDLLPGWSPNPATLLYGRVGFSYAKRTLKAKSTNVGNSPPDETWDLPLELSKSRTSAAFRAGAGLEQTLSRRISLRADYIYTDFGKISVAGFREGLSSEEIPVTVRNDTSLHLYDHALLLGLSYRFTCLEPFHLDPCFAQEGYKGFYAGGAIGGGILNASQHGEITTNRDREGGPDVQVSDMPSQLYNDQFQGMLFLGYGRPCRCFYLGAEVMASAETNHAMDFSGKSRILVGDTTLFSTTFDATVKSSTWQYALDFRPGVKLTPLTLLCGRVGVSAAEIKAHSTALNNGDFFETTWAVPVEASDSTWRAAFRLGLGIEHALCSRLHLRADYIFSNFGIVSFKKTAAGFDTINQPVTVTNTLSSHLQNHAAVVGLSYYFCR